MLFDVIIIGCGINSLFALSSLCHPSYIFNDEDFINQKSKYSFKDLKIGVIDKVDFLNNWTNKFELLNVKNLRSPLFIHPDFCGESSILEFIKNNKLENEIIKFDKNYGNSKKHQLIKEKIDIGLFDKPSLNLFNKFCFNLISKLKYDKMNGFVKTILKENTNYLIQYENNNVLNNVKTKNVIITSGRYDFIIPKVFKKFEDKIFNIYDNNIDLSINSLSNKKILIVGGGLTSCQLGIKLTNLKNNITICSKKEFFIQEFDVPIDFFGKKYENPIFRFNSTDVKEKTFIKKYKNGGTIPYKYYNQMKELGIKIRIQKINNLIYSNKKFQIFYKETNESELFDHIILSTGRFINPLNQDFLKNLIKSEEFEITNNLNLKNEKVYFMGEYAYKIIGLNYDNMIGSRICSKIICENIYNLEKIVTNHTYQNKYSILEEII